MSLSTKLVSLRKEHNLTQMELAEKLNVSRQAVSRWEVGAAVPSTDNLKVLSELYGVSVDVILKGEGEIVSPDLSSSDELSETQNCRKCNRKSKILFACFLILVALLAAIAAGIAGSNESEGNTDLPMGNMLTEEDDGGVETFSFE